MSKIIAISTIIVFGLITLGLTFVVYFYYGGFSLKGSLNNSDWGSFGSYFGGVSGPVLTYFSVVLIAYTLYEQRKQSYFIHKEAIKQNLLSSLNELRLEINALCGKALWTNQTRNPEFGDFVSGLSAHPNPNDSNYIAMNERLLKLTAYYCELLRAYEEDVGSDLSYKSHYRLANELVGYLKRVRLSNAFSRVSLHICEINLNGEDEQVETAKDIKLVINKISKNNDVSDAVKKWFGSLGESTRQ